MEAGAGLCQRRPPPAHPRPRLFPPPPLPSPVPGGPTHLVHRLRLETIWKFTHKMKPRLVLAQRFLGRKNNNKQTKKIPLPDVAGTDRRPSFFSLCDAKVLLGALCGCDSVFLTNDVWVK